MASELGDDASDAGPASGAPASPASLAPLVPSSSLSADAPRSSALGHATAISAALFLVAAWPMLLVPVPPLQDLPNHLATVTVIENPARYPEFAFNGFLKTNSALFTWLLVVGRAIGDHAAARLFVLLVLATGALALPRFVLAFGGRRRMVTASFFAWPMVHDWFVSMGMLDFALAVPLSALLLVLLERQREDPRASRALGVTVLSLVVWYAHAFPLLVVGLLVVLRLAADARAARPTRPRTSQLVALGLPLTPAAILVTVSVLVQLTEPAGAMTGYVAWRRFLPVWELLYNLWAEWFYGFTWLEIATLVPCVALALVAARRWREGSTFFGPVPCAALLALYVFLPYVSHHWFHVNSRLIPFLWLAALVRVPERLPAGWRLTLAACALSYSLGLGVDYARLGREWSAFTAGVTAVPRGARLLPLVFAPKMTSENTRSLLHAWGFYVSEKQTSAPLLFAHSRSFPLTYRAPPPAQFNHLVLEGFAASMASPATICEKLRGEGVAASPCDDLWRSTWADFWRAAEPEYDHVLLWAAPSEVVALVPARYRTVFQRGPLIVLARAPGPSADAKTLRSGSEVAEGGQAVPSAPELDR